MIARFSRIGARIWVGSPFRLSLEGLTGSQEASGAPPRSLGSSCTDGCHYAGTPLFGCRIGVPPKSPLLLVQGSSHASCAMCCVYAPFVFIYSSNVDTTSRFTRTSRYYLLTYQNSCSYHYDHIVLHLLLPLLNRLSEPSREIANVTPPSYAQRSTQIAHMSHPNVHHIQSGRKKHSSASLGKGVAPQSHVLLI